jgi:hypothetical protein
VTANRRQDSNDVILGSGDYEFEHRRQRGPVFYIEKTLSRSRSVTLESSALVQGIDNDDQESCRKDVVADLQRFLDEMAKEHLDVGGVRAHFIFV